MALLTELFLADLDVWAQDGKHFGSFAGLVPEAFMSKYGCSK
jgi:hypothetical protein